MDSADAASAAASTRAQGLLPTEDEGFQPSRPELLRKPHLAVIDIFVWTGFFLCWPFVGYYSDEATDPILFGGYLSVDGVLFLAFIVLPLIYFRTGKLSPCVVAIFKNCCCRVWGGNRARPWLDNSNQDDLRISRFILPNASHSPALDEDDRKLPISVRRVRRECVANAFGGGNRECIRECRTDRAPEVGLYLPLASWASVQQRRATRVGLVELCFGLMRFILPNASHSPALDEDDRKLPISVRRIEVNDTDSLYIVGTMHISTASARDAWLTCVRKNPKLVMIELDRDRLRSLRKEERAVEASFVLSGRSGAAGAAEEDTLSTATTLSTAGGENALSEDDEDDLVLGDGSMLSATSPTLSGRSRNGSLAGGLNGANTSTSEASIDIPLDDDASEREQNVPPQARRAAQAGGSAASSSSRKAESSGRTSKVSPARRILDPPADMNSSSEDRYESFSTASTNSDDSDTSIGRRLKKFRHNNSAQDQRVQGRACHSAWNRFAPKVPTSAVFPLIRDVHFPEGSLESPLNCANCALVLQRARNEDQGLGFLEQALIAERLQARMLLVLDYPECDGSIGSGTLGLMSLGGLRERVRAYRKFKTWKVPTIPAFLFQNRRASEANPDPLAPYHADGNSSNSSSTSASAFAPMGAGARATTAAGDSDLQPPSVLRELAAGAPEAPSPQDINRSFASPPNNAVYDGLSRAQFATIRLQKSYNPERLPYALSLRQTLCRTCVLVSSGIGVLYGVLQYAGVQAGAEFVAADDMKGPGGKWVPVTHLPPGPAIDEYARTSGFQPTCVDVNDHSLGAALLGHMKPHPRNLQYNFLQWLSLPRFLHRALVYSDQRRPDVLGISLRALAFLPGRTCVAFLAATLAASVILSVVLLVPVFALVVVIHWIARLFRRTKTAVCVSLVAGGNGRVAGFIGLGGGEEYMRVQNLNGFGAGPLGDLARTSSGSSTVLAPRTRGDDGKSDNSDFSSLLTEILLFCVFFNLLPAVQRGLLMDRDEAMFIEVRKLLRANNGRGNAVLVIGAAHMPDGRSNWASPAERAAEEEDQKGNTDRSLHFDAYCTVSEYSRALGGSSGVPTEGSTSLGLGHFLQKTANTPTKFHDVFKGNAGAEYVEPPTRVDLLKKHMGAQKYYRELPSFDQQLAEMRMQRALSVPPFDNDAVVEMPDTIED
eukprot:g6116.t1